MAIGEQPCHHGDHHIGDHRQHGCVKDVRGHVSGGGEDGRGEALAHGAEHAHVVKLVKVSKVCDDCTDGDRDHVDRNGSLKVEKD